MEELDCIDLFIISVMWTAAVFVPILALHGIYALLCRFFRREGR